MDSYRGSNPTTSSAPHSSVQAMLVDDGLVDGKEAKSSVDRFVVATDQASKVFSDGEADERTILVGIQQATRTHSGDTWTFWGTGLSVPPSSRTSAAEPCEGKTPRTFRTVLFYGSIRSSSTIISDSKMYHSYFRCL